MAISRSVRPSVLVAGEVVRVRELRRKSDQSTYGSEVILAQPSGAQIAVTIYDSAAASIRQFPEVRDFFTAECTVEESRDYGATLIYESEGLDTLDRVHSALGAVKA